MKPKLGSKQQTKAMPFILREADVARADGLSVSTRQRMILRGEYPAPRQIGKRLKGWLSSDIELWLASRPVADFPPPFKKKAEADSASALTA